MRFHTAHKLLVLAHAPEAYRQLGRLVAGARGLSRRELEERFIDGFMGGLAQLASARRHTNVLQHMAGYFKDRLDATSKRELADTIADCRRGLVPLVVPLTLLRHDVRLFEVAYLAEQTYLQPHPKELMLRITCKRSTPLLFDDLGKHAFELVGIDRFREVMMDSRVGR